LAVFSIAVFVASLIVWVRSYSSSDAVQWDAADSAISREICTSKGMLWILSWEKRGFASKGLPVDAYLIFPGISDTWSLPFGGMIYRTGEGRDWAFGIGLWLIALLTALIPVVHTIRSVRRRRRRHPAAM